MGQLTAIALSAMIALAAQPGCGGGDDAELPPDEENPFVATPRGPFPDGFLWGTAIAPYQVEGGLHETDWYQWETLCASCSGESADDGPGFWDRYETDLDNAASLANNTIRIGLDWSRVFPTEQRFRALDPDADAVARYRDIITAARARGLEVMVTLIHFALPVWVHDLTDRATKPGWEGDAIVGDLAGWAGWAAGEFGADVDLWITLNEPVVNAVGGWISGDVPPGEAFAVTTALEVAERMVNAHARAYDAIHAADFTDADGDGAAARVSIAKHNRVFLPLDPDDPQHVRAADVLRYLLNDVFLQAAAFGNLDRNYDLDLDDPEDVVGDPALSGRLDFIGLNYYGVTLIAPTANEGSYPLIGIPFISDLDEMGLDLPKSDFGWAIDARGLRRVLDELDQYGLPIIITENGVADGGEALRARFLLEHLYVINQAIDEGADIEGYYHWSLMDNFEWSSGYCPKFGLFRVDFDAPDRARTGGEGGEVYRAIIEAGTVPIELFDQHRYGTPAICPRAAL